MAKYYNEKVPNDAAGSYDTLRHRVRDLMQKKRVLEQKFADTSDPRIEKKLERIEHLIEQVDDMFYAAEGNKAKAANEPKISAVRQKAKVIPLEDIRTPDEVRLESLKKQQFILQDIVDRLSTDIEKYSADIGQESMVAELNQELLRSLEELKDCRHLMRIAKQNI